MSDLKPGMNVLHPVFGAGKIRAVSGSGPDARITVDFAGSVGQKKLLAGVASLKPLGGSAPGAPAAPGTWIETLQVKCAPKSGRRPLQERIHEAVRSEIHRQEFWIAVRERMRGKGLAPRVLDQISGHLSISLANLLNLEIRIRHHEMIKQPELLLARTIFEIINERLLADFEVRASNAYIGVIGILDDDNIIVLPEGDEPSGLPDRAPRRRPLPVTPKGVIKNRPRRRDDY